MNPTGVFSLSNLVALSVHSANLGSLGTFPALHTLTGIKKNSGHISIAPSNYKMKKNCSDLSKIHTTEVLKLSE
jgi:hypothetical protein